MYRMSDLITYDHLKESMMSSLSVEDCKKLMERFQFPKHQLEAISNSQTPVEHCILALEERGVVTSSNTDNLARAFTDLSIGSVFYQVLVLYQNTRTSLALYDNFLVSLSAHLTASVTRNLCRYFNVSDGDMIRITSGQNPGLSLLLTLHEVGVIKPSEVGTLEEPLKEFGLIQAVAKIHEYKSLAGEEGETILQSSTNLSYKEKKSAFIQCLRRKIKHWYETTTPVPWKKSCKWKLSDLFVGSALIIIDANKQTKLENIDERCKLNYTEIFSHKKLESDTRVAIAGDPGSGKTVLMTQLAYDWSQGEFSNVKILIFLPLKSVGQASLSQAIKDFYVPNYSALTVSDIELILQDGDTPTYLLLDGLEEYMCVAQGESSDVMKVMSKEKYPDISVVITSRSDFTHHLPTTPVLKLSSFGEKERKLYIEKVFAGDTTMQQNVIHFIEENPLILHLCSIPLTFALAVHNVEKFLRLTEDNVWAVGPFMETMIETLRYQQPPDLRPSDKYEMDNKDLSNELPYLNSSSEESESEQDLEYNNRIRREKTAQSEQWNKTGENFSSEASAQSMADIPTCAKSAIVPESDDWTALFDALHMTTEFRKDPKQDSQPEVTLTIDELAFNGLCRGTQLLSWEKGFVEQHVGNIKEWIDSGILVIEESFLVPPKVRKGKNKHRDHDIEPSECQVEYSDSIAKDPKVRTKLPLKTETPYETDTDQASERSRLKYTSQKTLMQVPLQVKFLHKIIQEWFAAKHLSSLLWRSMYLGIHQQCLDEHMPFIPAEDLHYILRFTCFLCPPSCHLIIKHLIKTYRHEEGTLPEYIMKCIFLCLVECGRNLGNAKNLEIFKQNINDVLTEVFKQEITIFADDSKFLQQAKVTCLTLASSSQIVIRKLRLSGVVLSTHRDFICFDSGVLMGILDTVEEIEISRWDLKLKEDEYVDVINDIIAFIGKCLRIKNVRLHFPPNPPKLHEEMLDAIKNKTVLWFIGEVRQTLDTNTGEWMIGFGQEVASTNFDYRWPKQFDRVPSLESEAIITRKGVHMTIPDTTVSLVIPANALPSNMDECKATLRIIPRLAFADPCKSFSSNSAVVVEILPNNLTLQVPAELRIPHCLLLNRTTRHEAKVYMSHHKDGCKPLWEEEAGLTYAVKEKSCIIRLNRFCWVTVKVGDKDVLGKHVIFYACGKHLDPRRHSAEIAVGYYHNLDGEGEFLQLNTNMNVSQKMPYVFLKEGARPLSLLLESFSCSQWQLWPSNDNKKIVPFDAIDSKFDYTWPLLFRKTDIESNSLMCSFKASQEQGQHPIELKICIETERDVQPSHNEEEHGTFQKPLLDCFMYLKKNLEEDWRDLGRYLGLSEGELKLISEQYKPNIEESIYQMLHLWQKKNGSNATCEKLVWALHQMKRTHLVDGLAAL